MSVPDARLEHEPKRWRQLSDSLRQKLRLLCMNQPPLRVECAILQNRTQRPHGFFSSFVDRDRCAPAFAQPRKSRIDCDSCHPGVDTGSALETLQVSKRTQKRILEYILCIPSVLQNPANVSHQSARIASA